MNPAYLVPGLLLAFAIFGYLRARASVEETWGIRVSPRMFGTVLVLGALAFLLFTSRSMFGAIVGGIVLAASLYATYRLRHSS